VKRTDQYVKAGATSGTEGVRDGRRDGEGANARRRRE